RHQARGQAGPRRRRGRRCPSARRRQGQGDSARHDQDGPVRRVQGHGQGDGEMHPDGGIREADGLDRGLLEQGGDPLRPDPGEEGWKAEPSQEVAVTSSPKRDVWDKLAIILQPVGGLLTALAIALFGYFSSAYLNRNQAIETNTRLYSELMSRRE